MPNPALALYQGADPTGPLTAQNVIDLYLANSGQNQSTRAFQERHRILVLFAADLGQRSLDTLQPMHLLLWINGHPDWKSDWTILRVIRTIQRPFAWAAKLGWIVRNPLAGMSHRQGERGRPMEPEEFQRLMRRTDPCFQRVLIFLKFSGARPGEARELEWPFLDLERACAVFRRHKTVGTRRDRAPRVLILHPVAIKLLIWIRRHDPHEQYVFTNSKGRPWTRSALDLRMFRLRRALGIPSDCKLYGARHAFATRAVLGGVDLATLAQLLGHSTTRMSEHYLHLAGQTEHLQAAVERAMRVKRL